MSIRKLLEDSSREHAQVAAICDWRKSMTWGELESRVSRLARVLAGRGVASGDRVAIIAKNRWEFVALYFACAEIGAVLVPLNWRLKPSELSRLLDDSRARAVFAETEFARTLAAVGQPRPMHLFASEFDPDAGSSSDGWIAFEQLSAEDAPALTPLACDPTSVAIQMYTSGTTGVPKGAMLTHCNVCSLASAWACEIDLRAGTDRFLQVTPLFHVGGMLMLMSTALVGATLLLHREFQPDLALRAMSEDGATHALFVPAMLHWLLMQPDVAQTHYPDLRLIAYGAAPADADLLRRTRVAFDCELLQGYGLTETAGVLTVLRATEHRHPDPDIETARLNSIGRAIACCEVRIVDERGQCVAPGGHVGELVARGENVFGGYWEMQAETESCFHDGWFKTGDLAHVDADGFITLVDRIKDMILVGGENVYPSEVERMLVQHIDVADAAVIGIPHEVWGEEVLAFVQLMEGASASDRALIQHCRSGLARFKCPTQVRFLDRIPRNAAGKCEKAVLRSPFWEGRARKV